MKHNSRFDHFYFFNLFFVEKLIKKRKRNEINKKKEIKFIFIAYKKNNKKLIKK